MGLHEARIAVLLGTFAGGSYFLRGKWEDGDDRDFVLEALKSGVEVRPGGPPK